MIKYDLSNGEYHASPARSKSYLWNLYANTPAHAQYGVSTSSPAMELGTAVHIAALEPHRFEADVIKGPDDRRGNKWKDAVEEGAAYGKLVLTSGDYDKARRMGESVRNIPLVGQMVDAGGMIFEASAFWRDEGTKLDCRCRPDVYSSGLELMADLKTTSDASPHFWATNAARLGYHAQEAWYTDGWQLAGGGGVDGFLFIAVESDYPHLSAAYELKPEAVAEGRLAHDEGPRCLRRMQEFRVSSPGYSDTVQEIDIPACSYKESKQQYSY